MVPTQFFFIVYSKLRVCVRACVRNTLVGAWVHNRIRCDAQVRALAPVRQCVYARMIPYDASYDAGALSHHYRCVLRTTIGAYFALLSLRARAPVRPCVYARMI